jgi:hypothetical protein
MSIDCKDRERILTDGTPAEWAALEQHSLGCPACAEELRAWRDLSSAAQELRDCSDSPSLWPRIERALTQQAAAKKQRWGWLNVGLGFTLGWQVAAAAAMVVILAVGSMWVYRQRWSGGAGPGFNDNSLLKSSALAEVERTQEAYEQAIDKLAAEAKPQIANPASPLQESYREKLLVLDSAIDDLRAQAGLNPSNAHLRQQLLAMYQEKQQTLQDILEEKR